MINECAKRHLLAAAGSRKKHTTPLGRGATGERWGGRGKEGDSQKMAGCSIGSDSRKRIEEHV